MSECVKCERRRRRRSDARRRLGEACYWLRLAKLVAPVVLLIGFAAFLRIKYVAFVEVHDACESSCTSAGAQLFDVGEDDVCRCMNSTYVAPRRWVTPGEFVERGCSASLDTPAAGD